MPAPSEPLVYAWPPSAVAGETVALRVAGPPCEGRVQVARIGARRDVVWSGTVAVEPHELPADAAASGCPWPDAATVTVEPDWPSGFYEVSLRTRAGQLHESVGFFVVRAARPDPGRPLLVLSTNTWNAYNDFGGPNLYARGTAVSFARPLAPGYLRKPDGPGSRVAVVDAPDFAMSAHTTYLRDHQFSAWAGSAGWPNAELPFVRWAEANGYDLDYAVNADLELVPDLLEGRSLYLSVGHDEYWSAGMRDAVEDFVGAGGNACFFSGNTAMWQVRHEPSAEGGPPDVMVCFKDQFKRDPVYGTDRQHSLTTMWSDHLLERPENHLTGVTFTRGGYHRIGKAVGRGSGGYTIYRPEHWVFDGTDVGYGDLVGAESVTVGYECDGCELSFRDGLPHPTGADGTPVDLEVLALTPVQHFNHTNAPRPVPEGYPSENEYIAGRVFGAHDPATVERLAHGHAVMGIHERGGTVFTAGTTEWAWGLAGADPVVERVTRNLLERLNG